MVNTPYHSKKISDGSKPVVTAGFTPGGHIASGYSYLQRSHSYKTSTRRNVPQGLESPSGGKQFNFASSSPSPTQNPSTWLQRSSSSNSFVGNLLSPRITRQDLDIQTITDLVAQLPPNPKLWAPSQVALYLTHVFGLIPKPVVEDVTNYVRSSRMGGKVFMRLREKDLEAEGLNLKWRKLMIEAVKKLRRDCLRGRIWGYEGGLQLPRQDDDMLEEESAVEEELGSKRVSPTATGTLKRLRDKKAVRTMISSFETAKQDNGLEEENSVTTFGKGHRSRGSLSSLHSSDSSEQINRIPLAPIYGEGYVKSRAESYTSLSDVLPQASRKNFTKEELEHWFGSLSDQEAEALANELQEDEFLQQIETENYHKSGSRSYSSHSSISGESEALTPPPSEQTCFNLTPLDPEIIEAIVGQPLRHQSLSGTFDAAICVEPLHRDSIIDNETVKFERSQSLTHLRSELAKGSKLNLYRGSTYEAEDMVALGLHVDEDEDVKYSTARKITRPASDGEEHYNVEPDPYQEAFRVEKKEDARDIFDSVSVPEKKETLDHMRHMSALEAYGLSPYNAISPGMLRSPSQRKHGEGEKTSLAEELESRCSNIKESNMANFGRKGRASGLHSTSMLQVQGLFDDSTTMAGTLEDGKKAEDESEWGTTVSRKASRRGTLAKAVTRDRDAAPSRMADLFTPAPKDELNADNLKELEMVSSKDQLFVPMTTIESSEDGKSCTRKRSMVLVERKKFEALARRMGVLESQLAQLEATSLPSLSNLGSMSERDRSYRALDEIFTVPFPRQSQDKASEEQIELLDTKPESKVAAWTFPMLLGAIPSYVIGLSAGAGFVLLKEILSSKR